MKTLLFVLLAGCVAEQPPYDLEIKGDTVDTGADLHVRIVDRSDGNVLIANEWFPFERPVTYGDLFDEGTGYQLSMFRDRDGDTRCTSVDQAWTITIAPVYSNVSIDLSSTEPIASACFQ